MFKKWEVKSWVADDPDEWCYISGLTRMRALRKAQRVARDLESEYVKDGVMDYEIGIFDSKTLRLVSMTTADRVISHPGTPYERVVERC